MSEPIVPSPSPAPPRWFRRLLLLVVFTAFAFGFIPASHGHDFERLHIFLFNLTTGCTLLLYSAGGGAVHGGRLRAFMLLSAVYAITAFLEIYPAAILASLVMFILVESLRIRKSGFFPRRFFSVPADNAEKYRDAALLCLSIALLMAALVIVNDEYTHWFRFRKLTLNVFFLGYSFPVSLMCFSLMTSYMNEGGGRAARLVDHVVFWTINTGVIVFFLFILLETFLPMLVSAVLLALSVIVFFYNFFRRSGKTGQKYLLVAGMIFLLCTAVTGILYILVKRLVPGAQGAGELLLKGHAYFALYGWNLSGLLVILRGVDDRHPFRARAIALLLGVSVAAAIAAEASPDFITAALICFGVLLAAYDRYAETQ